MYQTQCQVERCEACLCEPCENVLSTHLYRGVSLYSMSSDRRCAFTSNQSTWDERAFADCNKNHGAWAFIYCESCIPGERVYRCTACYHKFQQTLRRRLPELERNLHAKVVATAELDALLVIDFRALAIEAPGTSLHPALQLVESGSEAGCDYGRKSFCWRGSCPCCYDFVVPDVQPAMPAGFAALRQNPCMA